MVRRVPMTTGRMWRFFTLGIGVGYTIKYGLLAIDDLRNPRNESNVKAKFTPPKLKNSAVNIENDASPEVKLARIHAFVFGKGEEAKFTTVGELAEQLKDYGGVWSKLAEAEGDGAVKRG